MPVHTVRGDIPSSELGVTVPHQHLLIDIRCWWTKPSPSKSHLADAAITLGNLGEIRKDCFTCKDNLFFLDPALAIEEVMEFKKMGGQSVVDVTPVGIGRKPIALKKISVATGLHVVCATGWYVAASHPSIVKEKSVDDLCDILTREVTQEIDDTGIKAGVIKVACSGLRNQPFEPGEEKVLHAAARAQARTGAPLTIHPNVGWITSLHHTETYLEILQEEDSDLNKFYLSHAQYYDLDYQQSLLDRGITICYDDFGNEGSWPSTLELGSGYSTDREMITWLLELLKAGYEKQILISNEIPLKHCLKKYGGYGYDYLLEWIVPELKHRGATHKQINQMLVENPKRLFDM